MVVPESEAPATEGRWKLRVGPGHFQEGPLADFGGPEALVEFEALREACMPLVAGAVDIPAMAMRGGALSLVPLLRHLDALRTLAAQGATATGPFAPFMDGPLFTVNDAWLRAWLDALAFSLSGLPAAETSAAAMAYVLFDLHREGAALDYPRGGMGAIVDALVATIEAGGSTVALSEPVASIDLDASGRTAVGVTLARSGTTLRTPEGVVCNAPVWGLAKLLEGAAPLRPEMAAFVVAGSAVAMTKSYLHLHLALDAEGLDLESLEAHYTYMDRGLLGGGGGPCEDGNMIAVSNPCKLDPSLAPKGTIVVHAYGCGNEPYEAWEHTVGGARAEYEALKEERAAGLWRAVEAVIPDARRRAKLALVGSPLTHERFLRRARGTYGATFAEALPDCTTPIARLVLCGDSVFPGIGVPAVALNGASAANTLAGVWEHWRTMDRLSAEGLI